tara:strand:+ start:709 stop:882 length:174 start_codon:yes stop_codon:yes gene_type:complete
MEKFYKPKMKARPGRHATLFCCVILNLIQDPWVVRARYWILNQVQDDAWGSVSFLKT